MPDEKEREEEEPDAEMMPEPEPTPKPEPMQYDLDPEIEAALGLVDPSPAKRSAAVAAEVVTRQQLNLEAERSPQAAPVGGAGKRKSKGSKRYVLLPSSQETAGGRARTNFGTDFDVDGINLNGEYDDFGNGNGSADSAVTLQTSCRYAQFYYLFTLRRWK